jgi:hypothetical protein
MPSVFPTDCLSNFLQKRVARKPAEYGSVVDGVEVRFQDHSESIEFEGDVSLALLHFQLSPDGGLIKDAKAWPQIWAVMEESSGTGALAPLEPARVDATKETAPKGKPGQGTQELIVQLRCTLCSAKGGYPPKTCRECLQRKVVEERDLHGAHMNCQHTFLRLLE